LKEGKDKGKDQSYVLFSLSQEQLSKTILPLAGLRKKEVRNLARRMRLPTHAKVESQEICFVQDDYVKYLSRRFKGSIKPGPILDERGNVLGEHKGVPFYTIGQREGLGIAYKHPLYVLKIDKDKNALVVGPRESRLSENVLVKNINWIDRPEASDIEAMVKIRSQHKKASASLHLDNGSVTVKFDRPQESPTPGQAAVFYRRDAVLGGGWIDRGHINVARH
jgi:tRNA-specific 2-thiouridylase